jgi:hypothetical protein
VAIRTGAECMTLQEERRSHRSRIGMQGGEPSAKAATCCWPWGASRTRTISDWKEAGIECRRARLHQGRRRVPHQRRRRLGARRCNGRAPSPTLSYNDYEIVAANLFDKDPRDLRSHPGLRAVHRPAARTRRA